MTKNNHKLPDGWQWVKLGDVCAFTYGKTLTESQRKGGNVPVYGSNGIIGWHNKSLTNSKTIIIGRKGSIGKINFSLVPCYPIDTTYYIEQTNIEYDLYCLYYFLLCLGLENLDKSAAVPGLNRNDAYDKLIPLPPLSEQKRIAAILNEQMSAVETARKATEAQLEAALTLPSAYLRSYFNSDEAKSWKQVKLGKHNQKIGSGVTPRGGESSYLKQGIPLIRSQNVHLNSFSNEGLAFISDEQDKLMQNSRVYENDVLLNITGASIGRVCVVPSNLCPANVNQHVCIIRSDGSWESNFISYYLSNPEFQNFIWNSQAGATRQALTKNMIENFSIPLPPLERQREIAIALNEKMRECEKLKKSLEEQLEAINKLPSALLRRAFNGEL